MNALLWDPALEQVAQEYANGCTFAHNANRTTRFRELQGSATFSGDVVVGENLAIGTLGAFTAAQLAAGWVNESTSYGYTPIASGGATTGHFTQVAWAKTRYVGCGVAECSGGGGGARGLLVVCDYASAGNYLGQLPWDAGTSCAQCEGDRTICVEGLCHGCPDPSWYADGGTQPAASCVDDSHAVRHRRGLRRQGPLRDGSPDRRAEAPRWVLRQQGRLRAPGRGLPQRLQRRGVLAAGRGPAATEATRAPGRTAARARMEGRAATAAPARTGNRRRCRDGLRRGRRRRAGRRTGPRGRRERRLGLHLRDWAGRRALDLRSHAARTLAPAVAPQGGLNERRSPGGRPTMTTRRHSRSTSETRAAPVRRSTFDVWRCSMRTMGWRAVLGVLVLACAWEAQAFDDASAARVIGFAQQRLAATEALVSTSSYPKAALPNGTWTTVAAGAPIEWTQGFLPGSLWRLFQATGDPAWRVEADRWTRPLEVQKTNAQTHDLGFKVFDSFGRAFEQTQDPYYRGVLLTTAATLATRFNTKVGIIDAADWNPNWRLPMVIDTMMNLELLLWGAQNGGDPAWQQMAVSHALKTISDLVRPDGSTFQVVDYDPTTGAIRFRGTYQGFSDSSTWARGQAWAIYGFTMVYRYTRDPRMLDTARRTADYYLSRLPADFVPKWDFDAPDARKDSSAAAIVASGAARAERLRRRPRREAALPGRGAADARQPRLARLPRGGDGVPIDPPPRRRQRPHEPGGRRRADLRRLLLPRGGAPLQPEAAAPAGHLLVLAVRLPALAPRPRPVEHRPAVDRVRRHALAVDHRRRRRVRRQLDRGHVLLVDGAPAADEPERRLRRAQRRRATRRSPRSATRRTRRYHVRISANLATRRYSVWVRPPGAAEVQLARDFAFRSDAPPTDDLGQVSLKSGHVNNEFRVDAHQNLPDRHHASAADAASLHGDVAREARLPGRAPLARDAANTGQRSIEFDVTPLRANVDGVVGYADSSTQVTAYSSLALLVRMNPSGFFDVRNGADYAALASLRYAANATYHVRIVRGPGREALLGLGPSSRGRRAPARARLRVPLRRSAHRRPRVRWR